MKIVSNSGISIVQVDKIGNRCRLMIAANGTDHTVYLDRVETLALATALKESAPEK